MSTIVKKVAVINDLCGYGRAALTSIIPILSVMGTQVCPIPTAVLSSHTGGFGVPAICDLTKFIPKYMNHWKSLSIKFDCIYSGYLSSLEQGILVHDFINEFKTKDTIVVIDPVLGDNGSLYKGMNNEMISKMKDLIKAADIITPNITEAAFLLDKRVKGDMNIEEVVLWCKELSDLGPSQVIITSAVINEGTIYVVGYDKIAGSIFVMPRKYIPKSFPGTGDAFTSVLIGSILRGEPLLESINNGCKFIEMVIKETIRLNSDSREGIVFEGFLSKLL
ncbi:pyridoxal kinase [Clostridium polyendosporum]|uniref:pyridoxal kinase n=1 Tax=Clostridium polyendosporum TaxID=69208 RepID=A0A919RZJ2_9CLOT|nr:pyridoxamine kinase [Clostridium polyendosporum]GIM29352.1 pyridoxal kinase [Clostridium polyendosporum]